MLDVRGEKYRIESRIFRLRGLGAARRAFNAILANVRLRGMCVLADDVGFCAIKTGGGGAVLGSLVGMDVWGESCTFSVRVLPLNNFVSSLPIWETEMRGRQRQR